MKTPFRSTNPVFCFLARTALLLAPLVTSINELNAQAIGGLPNKNANPTDSGGFVPNLFNKPFSFLPLEKGGVLMHSSNPLSVANGEKQCGQRFLLDRNGRMWPRTDGETGSSFHHIGSQKYIGFMHPATCGTSIGTPNPNVSNADTIVRSVYDLNGSSSTLKSTRMVLDRPYRGDFRAELHQWQDQTLVYALTHHVDSVAIHNEIHLFHLGADVVWNNQKRVITGKLMEKSAVLDNQVFLLCRENTTGIPGNTSIEVLNNSLQPVLQNLSGLDPLLVQGKIEIFSVLPDGKMLVGGLLQQNGSPVQALVRLLPNGAEDPAFTKVLPGPVSGFKWDLATDGRVRMASVDSNVLGSRVRMSLIGVNGGIESTVETELDRTWPVGKALMFHPDLNAFLFETGDIIPERSQGGGGGRMPPMVFRFYVGFNQKISPLVAEDGYQPYSWGTTTIQVNERLGKMTVSNQGGFITTRTPYLQYNGKLLPQFVVLNKDATPDTAFKGFLHFPKSIQRQFFQSEAFGEAQVVAGKKLLITSRDGATSRFRFDGSEDTSFQPYSSAQLMELKEGGFVSFRGSDSVQSLSRTGSFTVIKVDSFGNYQGDIATYNLDMSVDTLSDVGFRWAALVGEDNLKGIWMYIYNIIPLPVGERTRSYLIRFDPSGSKILFRFDSLRAFRPNDLVLGYLRAFYPKVLPDGTFEIWTNAAADQNFPVKYYHKLVFSSTGQFLSKTEVFKAVDGFGPRSEHRFRLVKRLSDGKFLVRMLVGGAERYYVRFLANGQFDPSFMPIFCRESYVNLVQQFGNQLMFGLLPPRGLYNEANNLICGPLSKNGIYSFTLNTLPADKAFIQGKVEQVASPATGCNPVGVRNPTPFTILTASPGGEAGISDKNGFYSLLVSPGNHQIRQQTDNDFLRRQICPAAPNLANSVTLPQAGDVALNTNFLNQTFNCPRLTMQLLQPRFRLCSKSQFTIRYANDGMATEPNARIRLNLPQAVKLLSASMPFTTQGDSSYVFALGSLAPGAKGSITIQDTVACISTPDSLVRACFSARMEPLSVCGEVTAANIGWNGAWLDAKAQYNQATGNVRFAVYNRGSNMTDSTNIRFSSPQTSVLSRIKLSAGDSLVFFVPGTDVGRYQLHLTQPEKCPLGTDGVLVHAGRTTAPFYLSFGNGWLMGQTATACPAFRFSYDPNEKVVEPVDPVEPGAELSYTIHFENYGNDTAYAVVITDTLPPGLDIRTFRMMGSSHECRPSFDGTTGNPIVNFNFLPIKLPGKKQDSILSKGQVDFKIRLKDNVALGSIHQNRAHIYFDRNEAIITNTTVTKVRNPDVPTEVGGMMEERRELMVYPNPNQGSFNVRVPKGYESGEVSLTDIQGRLVMKTKVKGDNALSVQNLRSGIYFVYVNGLKPVKIIVTK